MKKEYIAVVFLLFFFILAFPRIQKDFVFRPLPFAISNPFVKNELIGPLPNSDPVRDLETILRERQIDLISSPVASESAIVVVLTDDQTRILFSANKDLALQVVSLQIILNKLTIEGRKARSIDFRFKDPIVVY